MTTSSPTTARRTPHHASASGRGRRTVVLYNPQSLFYTMPLALLAVGSHLDPALHDVVILDARIGEDPTGDLARAIENAICLGISVITGAPIRDAVGASRVAKRIRPDLPVIWGGWHPSLFGRECLEEPSVDVTVQGQGEETFSEIVDRLAGGRSLEGCAGCTFRATDGTVVTNPPRALRPVQEFRPHDYGLLDVERYFALKGKRQLDYVSSQGCQFRCAFCADPFVYDRQWVGLSPDRVGEELATLWDRYRFDDVNFQDETFFTRRDRVEAIAAQAITRRLPITWAGTMRADQGTRLPDDVVATCRQSGLRRVLLGVESGSDEMLQRIRKDIRIDQVFEAAEKIRRHGIAGQFPFIVGFPGERDESVQASLEVAKRLRAMSPEFRTPFFYFKPYPGTAITADACRNGYQLPQTLDEWAQFDFVGSVGGPWVSPEKFALIERFKYYQEVAWDRVPAWKRPLQTFARWRCAGDRYAMPLEMVIGRWLSPAPRLS